MLPAGYWAAIWAVLWQSTLINSILLIGSYWLRMPMSGHSIMMPIAAPIVCAALAIGSILLGTVLGWLAGWHSRDASIWAATGGFAMVYGLYCYHWRVTLQGDATAGIDGFQLILAVIAVGLWWLHVVGPLKR